MKSLYRITVMGLALICASVITVNAQLGEDALVEYRQGNYTRAVEITQTEIEADPGRIDAYVVLGWSLMALGRHQEANQWMQRAVEIRRWDARVLHVLGESHYRLGNLEQAIQYLQEYIAVNPYGNLRAQVHFFLGDIFYQIGEYHHADIAFSSAVEVSGRNPHWWVRLGQAREQSGNMQLARQAYENALELQPNVPEAVAGMDRLSTR